MVLFALRELLDLLVMTLALGYVFMQSIPRTRSIYQNFRENGWFNWENYKFAIYVAAPAVVLHELMHKFVALWLGLTAVFHAWYFGLFLGLFLKIINSPLILFAPGYVSISETTPSLMAITAFAGPATNLVLFFIAWLILDRARHLSQKQAIFLYMTKQINLFLFIFNMLPIPPLDGSKVIFGLFQALF
jgi:Zn-dependent protease